MKISIHQPAYIPWMPYFDRIKRSDLHIVLDHVQFEKNSYINRQRVNESWMTIPVKKPLKQPINQIEVNGFQWMKKHDATIQQRFGDHKDFRFSLFSYYGVSNLSDMLYQQLKFWLNESNIRTEILRSSWIECIEKKSDLVLELCKKFKATEYLSGPINSYLDYDSFRANDINITVDRQTGPTILEHLYGYSSGSRSS